MEECLVCFEETKTTDFVVFPCKHRICKNCIPDVFMYYTHCPVCDHVLTVNVSQPNDRRVTYECCKIFCSILLVSIGIFYLVNFAFKN